MPSIMQKEDGLNGLMCLFKAQVKLMQTINAKTEDVFRVEYQFLSIALPDI
jgi:hypothetical protein